MNTLLHSPKVQRILDKGEDMAPSEIKYMLNRLVSRVNIAKALNMKVSEFNTWWKEYNQTISAKKEEVLLTPKEYLDYRHKGLNDTDIAKLKFVDPKVIYKWKLENREFISSSFIKQKHSKTNNNLSKEQYLTFKNDGVNDVEIANILGIHRVTLALWKKKNFSKKEIQEMSMRGKYQRIMA